MKTSIHICAAKYGAEKHNRREKEMKHVHSEYSHLNKCWEAEDGGVKVAVMGSAATRARPLPDIQVLCIFVPEAAAVADLGGREPSSDTDDCPPIPFSLVIQHPNKFTPRNITDRPCKIMIFHHVRYL